MKTPFLSPLILSSDFAVSPITKIGSEASAIPYNMLNPNKSAMLVDAFRFTSGSFVGDAGALGALRAEIKLGGIPLTRYLVPVGVLGARYIGSEASVTWHLTKPLYVPPGVPLSVRIVEQSIYPTQSYTYDFSDLQLDVLGRSLPLDYPVPTEIDVPWVTATQCTADVQRFVGDDADLSNPFGVPLEVRCFIAVNAAFGFVAIAGVPQPNPANITVQMTGSNGTMFIREPTPFAAVFPSERGLLDVNAKLQPGQFYRCELELLSVPAANADAFNTLAFTAIGMHGYRKVQTPLGVRP
jgi:hypothetical protein